MWDDLAFFNNTQTAYGSDEHRLVDGQTMIGPALDPRETALQGAA
jgi:hypothetical protein